MAATTGTRQSHERLSRQAVMISSMPGAAGHVQYLRSRGFDISLMPNGKTANEQILAVQPPLAILETCRDDADGLDILEKARSEGSATRFIVISPDTSLECAVRAMQLGALDFLPKPFEPGRLAALIHGALGLPGENRTLRLSSEIDAFLESADDRPVLRNICTTIERAAYSRSHVSIAGADSFIREICARAIHNCGPRRNKPFIAMNCTAIPKALVESELFGHVKGAFHGAACDRAGLASDAHGGTLFLDGISELDLGAQKKMQRFAEHGTFQRVGKRVLEEVNVRLVCGWPSDPGEDVRKSRLRQDLHQRLSGISLVLPHAGECRMDSLRIAKRFVFRAAARRDDRPEPLPRDSAHDAEPRSWHGDARELQQALESAMNRPR